MDDKITKLDNLVKDKTKDKSHIVDRIISEKNKKVFSETVSFPKVIQIETTNICNHGCTFCAYTTMERPKRHINKDVFKRIIKECYELGSREVGLFSGAEPMTCKWLDEYIKFCKDEGYTYTYISTNGSLGNFEKYQKIIDAGIDSIKFSVNGGTKEVYKDIHGKDDFEKVIKNIKLINSYRKEKNKKLWLGISFVAVDRNRSSFEILQNEMKEHVDEIIMYEANNQGGQVDGLPSPDVHKEDCALPFTKAHFSAEGYMRACCNDYENLLAIDKLDNKKIIDIWNGKIFRNLRKKHLEDDLQGTMCGKCIRNCEGKISPINPLLV